MKCQKDKGRKETTENTSQNDILYTLAGSCKSWAIDEAKSNCLHGKPSKHENCITGSMIQGRAPTGPGHISMQDFPSCGEEKEEDVLVPLPWNESLDPPL